ncbi:amidohydrolase family protein [Pseudonocardia kunmingensis]|uniref:Putative TIM-barrel fold metal-dependent hydrolase n=1 Tax=Pseudonocardia kunmingensis TaxID=630975 RepID=A0A543E2N0_9PSEU|nr:amidohydrolase family protein [Pseudonocardia kunmingensis]TQM15850.1 putative TIM-barrel fold metal-dependent hydrolase [Pseudonocardia kunmingensis]
MTLPTGATDVHAHVMTGPGGGVPGAVYAPFEAPVERYLAHLDDLGLARGVLVTPSAYGRANGVLRAALAAAPDRLRGVAVVGPDASDDELAALAAAGVRGCRVQDRFAGGTPVTALPALQERVAGLGWHVEVWTDPREHRALLREAATRGRVVLDHLGLLPAPPPGEPDPAVPLLRELLDAGDAWVTLSGAYRLVPGTAEAAAAPALRERVAAVLAAAPDRVVWGTDWPYVAPPGPVPTPADHRAVLADWLPDAELRRRVLVDNPARLYGWADNV